MGAFILLPSLFFSLRHGFFPVLRLLGDFGGLFWLISGFWVDFQGFCPIRSFAILSGSQDRKMVEDCPASVVAILRSSDSGQRAAPTQGCADTSSGYSRAPGPVRPWRKVRACYR